MKSISHKSVSIAHVVGMGIALMTLMLIITTISRVAWGDPASELRMAGQIVTIIPACLVALFLVFLDSERPASRIIKTVRRLIKVLNPWVCICLLCLCLLVISDGFRLVRLRNQDIDSQASQLASRLSAMESRMNELTPERWEQIRIAQLRAQPETSAKNPRQTLQSEISTVRKRLASRVSSGRAEVHKGIWSDVVVTLSQLLVAAFVLLRVHTLLKSD